MLGSAKSCLTTTEAFFFFFFFSKRILFKKVIYSSDRNANTVKSQTRNCETINHENSWLV